MMIWINFFNDDESRSWELGDHGDVEYDAGGGEWGSGRLLYSLCLQESSQLLEPDRRKERKVIILNSTSVMLATLLNSEVGWSAEAGSNRINRSISVTSTPSTLVSSDIRMMRMMLELDWVHFSLTDWLQNDDVCMNWGFHATTTRRKAIFSPPCGWW